MQHEPIDTRVLVLAPTAADAEATRRLLSETGIVMTLCVSEADLSEQVRLGAGAVLLTDDSLGQEPLQELRAVLDRQPSW